MNGSAQRVESPHDPTLAGRTVLVIDDHPDSRDLLTSVLQSLRARVIAARNIEEAEQKLHTFGADLIVCDMRLPDGSGLDFIKWLRAQGKKLSKTPCIAVTGWEQIFPPDLA